MNFLSTLIIIAATLFGAHKYVDYKIEYNNSLNRCIETDKMLSGFHEPVTVRYCKKFCPINTPAYFNEDGSYNDFSRANFANYEEARRVLGNCLHGCLWREGNKSEHRCKMSLENGDNLVERENWSAKMPIVREPMDDTY